MSSGVTISPLLSSPLGTSKPQLARDQRLVAPIMQVEGIGPVAARDFEHIAETLAGDQRGLRAVALDQGIDDQRGAVIDERASAGLIFALRKQSRMPSTKLS